MFDFVCEELKGVMSPRFTKRSLNTNAAQITTAVFIFILLNIGGQFTGAKVMLKAIA
jgi:hypothetical protein